MVLWSSIFFCSQQLHVARVIGLTFPQIRCYYVVDKENGGNGKHTLLTLLTTVKTCAMQDMMVMLDATT